MKIAIVHEMLIKLGGAEKVLLELISLYPDADVFTLLYDEKKVGSVFPRAKIHCTGPAQWFFKITGKPRWSLPFMPFSVRSIDLAGYDLVISSSSGFAHGIKIQKTKYKRQNNGSLLRKLFGNFLIKGNGDSISRPAPLLESELNIKKVKLGLAGMTGTKHICYCHSPARYLWDATEEVQREFGINAKNKELRTKNGSFIKKYFLGPIVQLLFWWLRRVDLQASKSPDLYIANSREVQKRIQKYYGRDSMVLWPPVNTQFFAGIQNTEFKIQNGGTVPVILGQVNPLRSRDERDPGIQENGLSQSESINSSGLDSRSTGIATSVTRSECTTPPLRGNDGNLPVSQRKFYVITSALTPFKRLDIPIRVFTKLGIPLKIIGSGNQREELEKIAGSNIQFFGRLSDTEMVEIYHESRGFLMPQKEDAGITPIEAMAAGIPVFGLAQGGLLESNIDGVTGRFFSEQTDESFEEGFLRFHEEIQNGKFDNPLPLITHAQQFDREKFREGMRGVWGKM